jgi:hypothetical protein
VAAGSWPPAVLIDECLGTSFAEYFELRGYTVYVVGSRLPAGSPDVSVVAAALAEDAIVVTTDSDFRRMREAATGHKGGLERADRIFFKRCKHSRAMSRIAELIDVIESEYRIAKAANRKFFVQITPNSYTVFR